jgi:hypothetical protein
MLRPSLSTQFPALQALGDSSFAPIRIISSAPRLIIGSGAAAN